MKNFPYLKKGNCPTAQQGTKKNTNFEKKEELSDEELVKKNPQIPEPEAPFEIKIIAVAPFFHVFKQKRVEFFSASLKDVEKTLKPKQHTDPATKLPPELHEFFELFSHQKANKLPPHRLYDHKIKFIKGKQPGYGFLYSMFQREFQILKKFFDENLAKGFIKTSSFPTAAPILFVRKPGKSFRLCVNYKAFNAITVKNKYSLPLIQENLNRLAKIKYFTKLNIVAAFNKIRMVEKKEWKTAFRTRYGLFEFLVMNFGLCGTPSFFQNYINDILHEHLNIFCSAYIDDIFIYSKTKKKTHETRSTNFSEIAKSRYPARHRKMRIFYQKNQIFRPDNNTRKYQNEPRETLSFFRFVNS